MYIAKPDTQELRLFDDISLDRIMFEKSKSIRASHYRQDHVSTSSARNQLFSVPVLLRDAFRYLRITLWLTYCMVFCCYT